MSGNSTQMPKVFLLSCLVASALSSYCQVDEFATYYPANPLYQKLKIQSQIDTVTDEQFHRYKFEFDTLGRKIAEYYTGDNHMVCYKYERKGDTLFCYRYDSIKSRPTEFFQFEKFIYNTKGKIIRYENFEHNPLLSGQQIDCSLDKFIYDEKGLLTLKLSFSKLSYPKSISKDISINDSLLILQVAYSYTYDKNNRLTIKKQVTGPAEFRTIDSLFYNNKNKIIKTITHKHRGYFGEIPATDISIIESVQYVPSKKVIKTTSLYHLAFNQPSITSETINSTYYLNGLLKSEYYEDSEGVKFLERGFVYTYY